MASGRSAKRARKKERRNTRREQYRQALRRRRNRRLLILSISSVVLIGGGFSIAMLAFDRGPADEEPNATPVETALDTVTPPIEVPVACDAELPGTAGSEKRLYVEPEPQNLDPEATNVLVLETSCGTIEIELDVENAPETTSSVAFLASEGFYDGTFFHRVVPSFVIQGGDPQGDGQGGPGYQVVEAPPEDLRYTEGIVAMAKGPPDPPGASGSQFFIVTTDDSALLPEYALVGRVIQGMDVVSAIVATGVADREPPSAFTYVERATVEVR
jgi:peptidyl-prolyl cis-trans isomerase B (cyclophilin B)